MSVAAAEAVCWPALRAFLEVPAELTGAGVRIAIVDGTFAPHPDVSSDGRRRTYHVLAASPDPQPKLLEPAAGPWTGSAQHGTWAAAAAAGAGALSGGRYAGVAPEAELYLVAGWLRGVTPNSQARTEFALRWLRAHGKAHGIRGIVPASQSGAYGTGLLPWQLDPIRVLCEALAADGFLVVVGTGNLGDLTCDVTQAQAPSALAVGGVALPQHGGWEAAAPYHGSRGTTFEGKWVPEVLAPAENLVLPLLGDEAARAQVYAGPEYGRVPEGYIRTGGTSFAGPAALGAAACVWQAHPEWTAAQVRAALRATAVRRPQWGELRAGLLSVAGAAEAVAEAGPADGLSQDTPFARYQRWRHGDLVARLRAIEAAAESTALEALLSFLPHQPAEPPLPVEARGPVRALLRHPVGRLRAGALCVLAGHARSLAADEIAAALADDDRHVRAAAVFALERCPALWERLAPALAPAFGDESLDVRRAALQLAGRLGDPRVVRASVEGLEEDVRRRRLGNYEARRGALAAITGVEIPEDPPWRPGECPDSDRRWQARLRVAAAWRAWLASQP